MFDMFSDEEIGMRNDYFGPHSKYDKFLWAVGVFSGNGAVEMLKYALDARLETFYPYRLSETGRYLPLWKNYLFIEYVTPVTVLMCRQSSKFIGFINFNNQPELVYRNAIDECMRLLKMGKYNFSVARRAPVERGTLVKVINDVNFEGKMVRLLCNVAPDVRDDKKVPVEFGRMRMMIEVGKLLI